MSYTRDPFDTNYGPEDLDPDDPKSPDYLDRLLDRGDDSRDQAAGR